MPTPGHAPDEDELGDLPPLDGDEREPPPVEGGQEGDVDEPLGEASLDDATGEDDPVDTGELDLDEGGTRGWLDEPTDAPGLDLGGMDVVELDEPQQLGAADDEGEAAEAEDLVLGDAPERGGLDAGDEGPIDPDEELRDEDLPALDADEQGDVDDALLMDPAFVEDTGGLPWAPAPWERVGAPLPLTRAIAVACTGRDAVVVGVAEGDRLELLRVDLEGTCQALASEGLDVASVTTLWVVGARIVAEQASGAIMVSDDGGAHFTEGTVAPPKVAPPRRAVAGIHRASPWVELDGEGLFVAASYAAPEDTTTLVRVSEDGTAAVVARLGGSREDAEADGRVRAMAYDTSRSVVWLAGGFGVAAFSVR